MNPTHILIVDDESRIRLMLRTALESEGYSVEEAGDGQEALETIRRRVPHLMILDLSMPALDGMGVLEQLKSLPGHEKPRVIVLTAYGSILAAVKATRLGVLHEMEGNERLARKFYGKAIAAKGTYGPAQKNMQRLYELHTYGHSDEEVTLGDEGELLTEWSTQV